MEPNPTPTPEAERIIAMLVMSIDSEKIGSSFRQEMRELVQTLEWTDIVATALTTAEARGRAMGLRDAVSEFMSPEDRDIVARKLLREVTTLEAEGRRTMTEPGGESGRSLQRLT